MFLSNLVRPDSSVLTRSITTGKLRIKGFTLIELLVVVLIIGILAAIALPQYERAVKKSRLAQAVSLVRSLREAEERYYMTNGEYTANLELLDISFVCPKDFSCSYVSSGVIVFEHRVDHWAIHGGLANRASYLDSLKNKMYCSARVDSPAEDFCKIYSATRLAFDADGWARYEIS